MAEQKQTAIQVLSNTTQAVQKQIDDYVKEGRLMLPPNYSAGNNLKLIQLHIQDNPKIMACSQASIASVMLQSCLLGLNFGKGQFYIIPYGNVATLSISYHGKSSICKRIDPSIEDIFGRVVKEGEEFDFDDSLDGYSVITKHKRTLASMNSKNVLAAYATIVYRDGKPSKSLIMPFDRIKKSWSKSPVKPIDQNGNVRAGTTHSEFTDEMCIRTVVAAICAPIMRTSSDADLFGETLQSVVLNETKAQADAEAAEKTGAGDFIDVDFSEVQEVDGETGEVKLEV